MFNRALSTDAQNKRTDFANGGLGIFASIGAGVGAVVAAPAAVAASGTIVGIPAGVAIEAGGIAAGGIVGGTLGWGIGRLASEAFIDNTMLNDLTMIRDSLVDHLFFSEDGLAFVNVDDERLPISEVTFLVSKGIFSSELIIYLYALADIGDGLTETKIVEIIIDIHGDTADYINEVLANAQDGIGLDSLTLNEQ